MTNGEYIGLRTNGAATDFDDIRVTTIGDTYFIHTDHLGSTSTLSDSDGQLVAGASARHMPFGGYREKPTENVTDRGYTGHKTEELGLIYMRARFFLPGIYRFVSADSLIPRKQDPQAYNRYAYVFNRAMTYKDPSGHWGCSGETDADRQQCLVWVDALLDMLRDDGGDVARGIYQWFVDFDAALAEDNGYGVLFRIGDLSNQGVDMRVPICGSPGSPCTSSLSPIAIEIDRAYLGGTVDAGAAALLGHEITHLWQGGIAAGSILGEIGAYNIQAILLNELDPHTTYSGDATKIHDIISDLIVTGSPLDINEIDDIAALLGSDYALAPNLDVSVILGVFLGYDISGQDWMGVAVEPVAFFRTLGQTSTNHHGGNVPLP